jgi:hypothetical protein
LKELSERHIRTVARFFLALPNKSLDASGWSVFRIVTGPAMLDSRFKEAWGKFKAAPNKRLQLTGISTPLIDSLPMAQLSPGR